MPFSPAQVSSDAACSPAVGCGRGFEAGGRFVCVHPDRAQARRSKALAHAGKITANHP